MLEIAQAHRAKRIIKGKSMASEEIELSLAWCVEHALIHAGEHWGQIQLTAQLHTGLS